MVRGAWAERQGRHWGPAEGDLGPWGGSAGADWGPRRVPETILGSAGGFSGRHLGLEGIWGLTGVLRGKFGLVFGGVGGRGGLWGDFEGMLGGLRVPGGSLRGDWGPGRIFREILGSGGDLGVIEVLKGKSGAVLRGCGGYWGPWENFGRAPRGSLVGFWGGSSGVLRVPGRSWRRYWGPKGILEKIFGCRGDFGGYWGPGMDLGAQEGDQMWVSPPPNVGPPAPSCLIPPSSGGSKVRSGLATSPAPPPSPSRDPQVGEGRPPDLSRVGGD